MTSFFKELQDLAISRVKNTLFLTFVIAWATVNYDFTLKLLFSDISIEEKIEFIKLFPHSLSKSLWLPLVITLIYQILLPLFNLWLTILTDKTVNAWVMNHKNQTLKKYYEDKREVETAKVENEYIARKEEIKIKKEEVRLEKESKDLEEYEEFLNYKRNQKYPSNSLENLTPKTESDDILSSLQDKSKEILKEISLDSTGVIQYMHTMAGSVLKTNGRNFLTTKEAREKAELEASISELEDQDLIILDKQLEHGKIYKITKHGYDIADKLE